MRKTVLSLAALALLLAAVDQVRADFIYWADENTNDIRRANLDGTGQQVLVTGQSVATGIALGAAADQMYWTNQGSSGSIRRADLNGSGQQTLIDQVSPFGIA
jgi:hypothetical protein